MSAEPRYQEADLRDLIGHVAAPPGWRILSQGFDRGEPVTRVVREGAVKK